MIHITNMKLRIMENIVPPKGLLIILTPLVITLSSEKKNDHSRNLRQENGNK